MPSCPACGTELTQSPTDCPDCGIHLASDGGPREGTGQPSQNSEAARRRDQRQRDTGSDVVRGLLGGVLAFVLGFVATVLLSNARDDLETAEQLINELSSELGPSTDLTDLGTSQFLPEPYKVLAWEFLENHQVSVTVSFNDQFSEVDLAGEYIELLLPASSELQVLPPLLLGLAGFFVATRTLRTDAFDAAKAGAHVALGYLPGIAVLAFISSFQVTAPFIDVAILEISPELATALGVAGLAYPLIFGALGGVAAFLVEQRR